MEARIRNTLTGAEPSLRPQAGLLRISPGARPAAGTNGFLALAESLGSVIPSVRDALHTSRAVDEQEAMQKGEQEAEKLGAEKTLAALNEKLLTYVENGTINRAQLPFFRRGLEARRGANLAKTAYFDALYSRLEETLHTDASVRKEPGQVAREVYNEVAKSFSPDDVYGRHAFDEAATAIATNFYNESIRHYTARVEAVADAHTSEEQQEILGRLSVADTAEERQVALRDLQTHITRIQSEGITKGQTREYLWKNGVMPTVESLAAKGDFDGARELLREVAEVDLVEGKGVKFGTPEIQNRIDVTLGSLAEQEIAYKRRKNFDAAAAREARGERVNELVSGLVAQYLDKPNELTDAVLAQARPSDPVEAVMFDSEVRKWRSTMDSLFVEDDAFAARLSDAVTSSADPLRNEEAQMLLAEAPGRLKPMTVLKLRNAYKAVQGALRFVEDEGVIAFDQAFPRGEAPLFVTEATKTDPETKKVIDTTGWGTLSPSAQDEVREEALTYFRNALSYSIAKDAAQFGPEGLQDSKRKDTLIQQATQAAQVHARRLTSAKAREKVAEVQKRNADAVRRNQLSAEAYKPGWLSNPDRVLISTANEVPAEKLPEIIEAADSWLEATDREEFGYVPKWKKARELSRDDVIEIRDRAIRGYKVWKLSNGFTPSELQAGTTDEGFPVDPSTIDFETVPVFESIEQLEREYKGGAFEPGGLFATIGNLLDPQDLYDASDIYRAQRALLLTRKPKKPTKKNATNPSDRASE